MLIINELYEDFSFNNIGINEIDEIEAWFKTECKREFICSDIIELSTLRDRVLESIISESEFFLKILIDGNINGIIKGRVEFGEKNEVYIVFLFLKDQYRDQGYGKKVLNALINTFINKFQVYEFFALVEEKEDRALRFFNRNRFQLFRVSKDFYPSEDRRVFILHRRMNCITK